jgi:hypothetical protein
MKKLELQNDLIGREDLDIFDVIAKVSGNLHLELEGDWEQPLAWDIIPKLISEDLRNKIPKTKLELLKTIKEGRITFCVNEDNTFSRTYTDPNWLDMVQATADIVRERGGRGGFVIEVIDRHPTNENVYSINLGS